MRMECDARARAIKRDEQREGEKMPMWNPWRGCKRCSDGCLHCYIHKGDAKRGIDTSVITQTKDFQKPVERLKNGIYKMKSGLVYTCFSTDFLIEEADAWRPACWRMMKERGDCTFLFLTKRIERLSTFQAMPVKHKCITAQPLLERVDIERYLEDIELVVVGGESDRCARPLDYDWVLDIREQCIRRNVSFEFRQCGTHFIKDGKQYTLQTRDLCSQARRAGINVAGAGREIKY